MSKQKLRGVSVVTFDPGVLEDYHVGKELLDGKKVTKIEWGRADGNGGCFDTVVVTITGDKLHSIHPFAHCSGVYYA